MNTNDLFGVTWAELDLEHVRAFLESVSGEGLLWEGKGHDPLSELHFKIVHGVCGLANQRGGIFIVGAEEQRLAGPWHLPGVPNNVERMSAHDWIVDKVNGGLVSPPPFDVKTWELDGGRLAAVVRIDQMPVPPCMTKGGGVWIRGVGKTGKVVDQRLLADMFGRGEATRADARARALRIAQDLASVEMAFPVDTVVFAMAATHAEPDYSSRLFRPRMEELLRRAAHSLDRSFIEHREPEFRPGRDGYAFVRRGMTEDEGWAWVVQAHWDGTVSVQFATSRRSVGPPSIDQIVRQGWRAMIDPLAELAGVPEPASLPAHLVVIVNAERLILYLSEPQAGRLLASTQDRPLQRWTTIAPPTEDELASVFRELARSGGANVYEPDTGPAAADDQAQAQ